MKSTVCIVGLGYVGLPLAYILSKGGHTVAGYDISASRIEELKAGHDRTRELEDSQLKEVSIEFSNDPSVIAAADIIIMAIPTPVDDQNNPDLSMVEGASVTVGKHLKKGAVVVYESTVYPGTTEEICGPILEKESGMTCGTDFTLGYSPERINPGDKKHTVDKIMKVVAGQDEKTLNTLCELYGSVITAGVHRAANIKVAEMAKAIENAQRDLNIAFVNEVAMLCHKIGINTNDVLEAASTKWNFLPFKPGLVGGHCIGVDPYYLVEKAKQLGMKTHVITAGRLINDGMSSFVAMEIVHALQVPKEQARILVLGLTFKEDIPDTRNSKAPDVATQLAAMGCTVEVDDPQVHESDWSRFPWKRGSVNDGPYDAVALLVSHEEYKNLPAEALIKAIKEGGVLYDLKSIVDGAKVVKAGRTYISL